MTNLDNQGKFCKILSKELVMSSELPVYQVRGTVFPIVAQRELLGKQIQISPMQQKCLEYSFRQQLAAKQAKV
jgi:hypothetical protein